MKINNQRFEYLDGLRGIAALVIVIQHFKYAFYNEKSTSIGFQYCWNFFDLYFLTGGFCVKLFFTLSGFILAYNACHKPLFLQNQVTKRVYRLFIPVFITSIIYLLFKHFDLFYFDQISTVFKNEWASRHWLEEYQVLTFIKKFIIDFMFFNDTKFYMNINSALWTIPVELFWSYTLFILFFILQKFNQPYLKNLCICLFSIVIFLIFKRVEEGLQFIGGVVIAVNYNFLTKYYNVKKINLLIFIFIIIMSVIIQQKWIQHIEVHYLTFPSMIIFLIILIIIRSEKLQSLLSITFLKWLGEISFSLYLIHLLIIGSVSSKLYMSISYFRNDLGLFILLILSVLLSFGLAQLVTNFIDKPFMNWFDKFQKKEQV
jgi:peptidoglycan/LPS O-acetylase OafA/YrhL